MISVIIPIYNLEDYLSNCLDSIIAQDNQDFEVILVNDGSCDHSEDICHRYVLKDSRFRLYNKANGGVSSARNLGLLQALGEWIAFVDGDDIVDNQYLTLPNNTTDIDVIEKSYHIKSKDNVLLSNVIAEDAVIDTNKELLKYYAQYIQSNSATLCNKIIRRNIIDKQQFDETKAMGEDFIFFLSILSRINKYYKMAHGSYNYIRRDTSASKTIETDQTNRVKILFANLNSVRQICISSDIKELGVNLIYTQYFQLLMSLRDYFSFKDWIKVFRLWYLFPWSDHTLITDYQKHHIMTQFPKYLAKTIIKKIKK